jgi:MoaF C-terminal domain/MoaF N-terminal domain
MPQQEGQTDYKYEDYAPGLAANRLPQTSALVTQTLDITLDEGMPFKLAFTGRNQVTWSSGDEIGNDWCEAVDVAPDTYFIDMTFSQQARQSQTFIVNVHTRRVLGVRTIMREGNIGKEPRAIHRFSTGILGDPAQPPTGRKPAPTRDLIGLRGLYDYGPTQCIEHIYLNTERYAWHGIIGPLRGQGDVDMASYYKFDDNQYIFAFREFGLPVSTVFFYNWDQMRSTGKFFAIADDGTIANTPAGAFIMKLSLAFYPLEMQPI